MEPPDDELVMTYAGRFTALVGPDEVVMLPPLSLLEDDHPIRRFVNMLCMVAHEMRLGPDAETYDPELAAFYARFALMPDDEFSWRSAGSDGELAEYFNVPLAEVRAKRVDLAFSRWTVADGELPSPRDAPGVG